MRISSAEFIKSAFKKEHWDDDNLPEIAFLGRSNVGKSSLINSLLKQKKLARTSNTPGRTQSINFFLINDEFYFADLPGYGFAKVPKNIRESWGAMAEQYLAERRQLVLCIQLIDARHEPKKLDIQLNEWLRYYEKPFIVAATKADKMSDKKLKENLLEIETELAGSKVIAYSSIKGTGRDELWREIENSIQKV